MQPLVDDMTAEDPVKRPTIDEVIVRFETVVKSLSSWKLRSRVIRREGLDFVNVAEIIRHWIRRIRYISKSTPAIPSSRAK